jgi:type II secretory pathway pseudopilin PulG
MRPGWKRRRLGMSLPEVVISTGIIGSAIFVAMPKYKEATQKAKEASLRQELTLIRKAVDQFNADTSGFPDSIEDLTREEPPKFYFRQGERKEWGEQKWCGPYLAFGEVGAGQHKNDPVSDQPYKIVRSESGRLKIFSSANGRDFSGVPFGRY